MSDDTLILIASCVVSCVIIYAAVSLWRGTWNPLSWFSSSTSTTETTTTATTTTATTTTATTTTATSTPTTTPTSTAISKAVTFDNQGKLVIAGGSREGFIAAMAQPSPGGWDSVPAPQRLKTNPEFLQSLVGCVFTTSDPKFEMYCDAAKEHVFWFNYKMFDYWVNTEANIPQTINEKYENKAFIVADKNQVLEDNEWQLIDTKQKFGVIWNKIYDKQESMTATQRKNMSDSLILRNLDMSNMGIRVLWGQPGEEVKLSFKFNDVDAQVEVSKVPWNEVLMFMIISELPKGNVIKYVPGEVTGKLENVSQGEKFYDYLTVNQ